MLDKTLKRIHLLFLNKKEVTLLTGRNYEEGAKLIFDNRVLLEVLTMEKEVRAYTKNKNIHYPTTELKSLDTLEQGILLQQDS